MYNRMHMGGFCLLNSKLYAWAADKQPYFSRRGKTTLRYATIKLNLLTSVDKYQLYAY